MADMSKIVPAATDRRIREELRVTLAAHRELGPEYEEQLIESFVDRIQASHGQDPAPQPSPRQDRRSHRGFLIALVVVVGWWAIAHTVGGVHDSHRVRYGLGASGGLPSSPPGISAPLPPAPADIH